MKIIKSQFCSIPHSLVNSFMKNELPETDFPGNGEIGHSSNKAKHGLCMMYVLGRKQHRATTLIYTSTNELFQHCSSSSGDNMAGS